MGSPLIFGDLDNEDKETLLKYWEMEAVVFNLVRLVQSQGFFKSLFPSTLQNSCKFQDIFRSPWAYTFEIEDEFKNCLQEIINLNMDRATFALIFLHLMTRIDANLTLRDPNSVVAIHDKFETLLTFHFQKSNLSPFTLETILDKQRYLKRMAEILIECRLIMHPPIETPPQMEESSVSDEENILFELIESTSSGYETEETSTLRLEDISISKEIDPKLQLLSQIDEIKGILDTSQSIWECRENVQPILQRMFETALKLNQL